MGTIRRMRRLFNLATIVSGLLCCATLLAWWHSLTMTDAVRYDRDWPGRNFDAFVYVRNSNLNIHVSGVHYTDPNYLRPGFQQGFCATSEKTDPWVRNLENYFER